MSLVLRELHESDSPGTTSHLFAKMHRASWSPGKLTASPTQAEPPRHIYQPSRCRCSCSNHICTLTSSVTTTKSIIRTMGHGTPQYQTLLTLGYSIFLTIMMNKPQQVHTLHMLGKKTKVLVKVGRKVKAPFGKGCLKYQNGKAGFQTTDLGSWGELEVTQSHKNTFCLITYHMQKETRCP